MITQKYPIGTKIKDLVIEGVTGTITGWQETYHNVQSYYWIKLDKPLPRSYLINQIGRSEKEISPI